MSIKTVLLIMSAIGVVIAFAFFSNSGRARPGRVVVFDHISVRDSSIAIHAEGKSDAIIAQAGTLIIGSDSIKTSPEQQTQLKSYYDNVIALRSSAISAGQQGIATAGTAMASVAKGLASGNPDNIADEVNKQADQIDVHAKEIDKRLGAIRAIQNDIASVIPEFRPYAFLD